MFESKLFGILLFSGSIAFVYGSKSFPFFMGHKRRLPWGRKDKNLRNGQLPSGELIISGSSCASDDQWKDLRSKEEPSAHECELDVYNFLDGMIIMCWVDEDGGLHNFYPINDNSIRDNSVSNKHTESTQTNHYFIWIKFTASTKKFKHISDIPPEEFIASYRPKMGNCRHCLKFILNNERITVDIQCHKSEQPDTPIDTSNKLYLHDRICGFSIRYEPDVFEACPDLHSVLSKDLNKVCDLLPPTALNLLQSDTCIWINKSLTYGPSRKPIKGTAMCFHPKDGAPWLRRMGTSVFKAGGIELYCPFDYVSSRGHWGDGGVMLHELAHAYHNKHCENGYDNNEIIQAYMLAMSRKLYDAVPVHGPQGRKGPTKAYACANCMEFWAELSVALLYTGEEEYNKWYPHNRQQLLEHDPSTYIVMQRLWGIIPTTTNVLISDNSNDENVENARKQADIIRSVLDDIQTSISNADDDHKHHIASFSKPISFMTSRTTTTY
eukprot:gene11304-23658_t